MGYKGDKIQNEHSIFGDCLKKVNVTYEYKKTTTVRDL